MALRCLCGLMLVLAAAYGQAQNYPARPISLVVPFAPGGPMDTQGRPLAAAMSKHLGQPVLIENIGGAGGTIGVARAAKAAPDGYTILMYHIGMATSPALYRKLDFDPLTDFDYVGLAFYGANVLVARSAFPSRSFADLVAYVRANKERVTVAHAGVGSVAQLSALLFMNALQTNLTQVGYKSTGQAMNDVVGGRVDLLFDSLSTATVQIKAGKLVAYGVTTRARQSVLPDVPTLEELGLQNFEMANWVALYAPRNTARPALERLVAALQGALRDPELKAILARLGNEPVTQELATPAALAAHLRAEIAKWTPVIKKAGIYAN